MCPATLSHVSLFAGAPPNVGAWSSPSAGDARPHSLARTPGGREAWAEAVPYGWLSTSGKPPTGEHIPMGELRNAVPGIPKEGEVNAGCCAGVCSPRLALLAASAACFAVSLISAAASIS